jgi:phosphomannomutase
MEGGNDYPLAKIMNEQENCTVFQAGAPSAEDGYKDTKIILEKLDRDEEI